MTGEKISYRVMKSEDYGNHSVFYKIECDCGSPDHQMGLELSWSDDIPEMLELYIYQKLHWDSYWVGSYGSWFSRSYRKIKKRIKGILILLFKGYIEIETDFLFQGEEHINNFIQAIQEGMKKIKEEDI